MNIISSEKMVCISKSNFFDDVLTIDKIYTITSEVTAYDSDIIHRSFIGDDGNEYLFDGVKNTPVFGPGNDFISLGEWRENKINKIIYEKI